MSIYSVGFPITIGDLQSQAYTTQQANGSFGAGIQYDLKPPFFPALQSDLRPVSAADRYSQKRDLRARNLNFETGIGEWNVLVEYNLLDLRDHGSPPMSLSV
jgi:hypothetical protein